MDATVLKAVRKPAWTLVRCAVWVKEEGTELGRNGTRRMIRSKDAHNDIN